MLPEKRIFERMGYGENNRRNWGPEKRKGELETMKEQLREERKIREEERRKKREE